jgi:cytidylate kinase
MDGPAGSGKSTVARRVAERLELTYLDSGALYRTLTYMSMREGVDSSDFPAAVKFFGTLEVELQYRDGRQTVIANGRDVTAEIRTPEVTRQVVYIAREPDVRKEMFKRQRSFGEKGSLIAEGRDMSSVVFPDADCKIYLDASVEVRAQRRHKELHESGIEVSLDQLREEIAHRDKTDMEREVAPLKVAEDAVIIDTSKMRIDEVIDAVVAEVKRQENK